MNIKEKINLWIRWIKQDGLFVKKNICTILNKKRIFLFDTADHNNLGDHAIALAELEFIKHKLPNYTVIEIPGGNVLRHTILYKLLTKKTDVITVSGGGFLGDLWPFEERIVQTVLKLYPNNRIVIFPQTFFFEEGSEHSLQKYRGYVEHKKLYICLRDKDSYDRFKMLSPIMEQKLFYMPDMVCGLSFKNQKSVVRSKAALCFRKDKEGIIDYREQEKLKKYLRNIGLEIVDITTIENRMITPNERKQVVYQKLLEFSSKKIIITDRLHAMLFAAIVGTPCIALDNKSGKVRGVYCWLESQEHIIFAKNIEEIEKLINQNWLDNSYEYDSRYIQPYWEMLSIIIKGEKIYG